MLPEDAQVAMNRDNFVTLSPGLRGCSRINHEPVSSPASVQPCLAAFPRNGIRAWGRGCCDNAGSTGRGRTVSNFSFSPCAPFCFPSGERNEEIR